MGDQDLLFTSPILLLSVSHCCKEFNLARKNRREREREAGLAGQRPRPYKDGILKCFFSPEKEFHNGQLANLILERSTAVRDVRRPL